MELLLIPAITIITFFIIEGIKLIPAYDKIKKVTPVFASVIGLLLSLIMYFTNYFSYDIWETIVYGLISGMAATGTNEIITKLKEIVHV